MEGTIGDLMLAKELYDEDREDDAIELLDRVLDFNEGDDLNARIAKVRKVKADTRVVEDSGEAFRTGNADDLEVAGGLLGDVMQLRCKCFSALLTSNRGTEQITRQALENVKIIEELYRDDPNLLALASQVFLATNQLDRALRMWAEIWKLAPNHPLVVQMCAMVGVPVAKVVSMVSNAPAAAGSGGGLSDLEMKALMTEALQMAFALKMGLAEPLVDFLEKNRANPSKVHNMMAMFFEGVGQNARAGKMEQAILFVGAIAGFHRMQLAMFGKVQIPDGLPEHEYEKSVAMGEEYVHPNIIAYTQKGSFQR